MEWAFILLLLCSTFMAETTLGWTYHYSNSKSMNWTQARRFCRDNYTDMVVIQSQRENDHVVSLLPTRTNSPYFWIGITKSHKDEDWTWVGNNSAWIGERSWAANEPNNNHSTEFCVEIYANAGANRGKWNDEKCSAQKSPLCYKAQCNSTVCDRGRCLETIENTTCLCEPGFEGDRCQTAVGCPPLSRPDNGYLGCSGGNLTFNSTCHFKCNPGFLMIGSPAVTCEIPGIWRGPRPICTSYKLALLAVVGSGAICTFFCCGCFCWLKHRKRKKLAQARQAEVTCPSSEPQE